MTRELRALYCTCWAFTGDTFNVWPYKSQQFAAHCARTLFDAWEDQVDADEWFENLSCFPNPYFRVPWKLTARQAKALLTEVYP